MDGDAVLLSSVGRRFVFHDIDREKLPFCYDNADRQLVGFDMDMANQLARDLGVSIEFVPFSEDSTTAENLS